MSDEQPSRQVGEEIDFSRDEIERLREQLGGWYARHRRDLPWRDIDDPYATWIAEIMLQQTQVATVVDYYHEWLERFPDVEAVADAEVDEVLEAWEGLGYYRRARFIHRSARRIVDEHGGRLPDTADELEDLPGIGPYTAGAIASIAFDRPEPVVDGNVSRVLSRLRAIAGDPTSTDNQKTYWRLADQIVDPEAPGDFNQAMMELGAMVCTPSSPSCLLCPVREQCHGFETGEPARFPDTASRARQKPVRVHTALLLARHGGGVEAFVMKRPAEGLLGGLWEFPTVEEDESGDGGPAQLETYLDGVFEDSEGQGCPPTKASEGQGCPPTKASEGQGCPPTKASEGPGCAPYEEAGEVTHLFSHLEMTIGIWIREFDVDRSLAPPIEEVREAGRGWIEVDRLDEVPMSAAMRRVEQKTKLATHDS